MLTRRAVLKAAGCTAVGWALSPGLIFSKIGNEMLQRKIPSSGEMLPVVGLGTWQQFDIDPQSVEKTQLIEVLQAMTKNGGKLVDSSPMYGRSEETIGVLATEASVHEKLFYATKVWTSGKEAGIKQMNNSFEKMKVKTMDLMQVHNLLDYKTHLITLKEWKAANKVKYIGVTHYTESAYERLEQIIREESIDFVQFNYSLRVRNAEKRLLNAAADKGVAVIINEPFEKGSLFSLVKGKPLPSWAIENDIKSWGQFFLKFILGHPAVNCVIPGTSNPKHAIDNMQAGWGKMPDENIRKQMIAYIEKL